MMADQPERPRLNTSDYSLPFHFDEERLTETSNAPPSTSSSITDLVSSLTHNASIPYTALLSSPSVRPLEFPAPTVERAVTSSSYVKDHRGGAVFYATSVLTRKSVHVKNCVNVASCGAVSNSNRGSSSVGRAAAKHVRNNSRDAVHSWHSCYGGSPNHYNPSNSQHTNNNNNGQRDLPNSNPSNNSIQECNPSCTLPNRAYCVRRKLCDTIYGSVRLCVVLKRISRKDGIATEGYRGEGEAVWITTDQMVAVKVSVFFCMECSTFLSLGSVVIL
jgi:hypothetical protein